MKTVRVVEYTDLDGENHTKDFENASEAVRFFMMVTSERLVKKAALYDKVMLAVNSIYSNEAEYLHLVFWNKTAENLCKYKGKGDLIAVTGYLKTRSYIDKENIVRNIVEVIVEQVDYLGYTKKGVDKSETIPKLDPDHKKQEEYQMIHDALCADEDLPF